jgi:hypothetical protein
LVSEPDGLCNGLTRIVTGQAKTALILLEFFLLGPLACVRISVSLGAYLRIIVINQARSPD